MEEHEPLRMGPCASGSFFFAIQPLPPPTCPALLQRTMSGASITPIRFTAVRGGDINRSIFAAALAGLVGLLAVVAAEPGNDWHMPALVLVGAGIGATLLRTTFGFAGAFRAMVEWRDASGFRAHALMLLVASALMLPLLAMGKIGGVALHGGETAVGVGFAVGALLFGAGMQIGGGCASGTLFALGGGNAKLLGTLAGFVVGSALGAAHMGFWWSLPSLPA